MEKARSNQEQRKGPLGACVVVISTALAFGSLRGGGDPWIVVPMLFVALAAFIYGCVIYRAGPISRIAVAIVASLFVGVASVRTIWLPVNDVQIVKLDEDSFKRMVAVVREEVAKPTAVSPPVSETTTTPVPSPLSSPVARPRANGDRLYVYSPYAYEWSKYLGATNSPRNESRLIYEGVPLRKPFGDGQHLLALGIANLNSVAVEEASLRIDIPQVVTLSWEHQKPPGHKGCWEQLFGWTYQCWLRGRFRNEIAANAGYHGDQLMLHFPKPDTYEFTYTLMARDINGKVGKFSVVLE